MLRGSTGWLTSALQGHPTFQSFLNGVVLGTVVSSAQVGLNYLFSPSESAAIESGSNRRLAGRIADDDPYEEPDAANVELTNEISGLEEGGNLVLDVGLAVGGAGSAVGLGFATPEAYEWCV